MEIEGFISLNIQLMTAKLWVIQDNSSETPQVINLDIFMSHLIHT